ARAFESGDGEAARSPGMRHKHYSPRATIKIVKSRLQIPDSRFQISDPEIQTRDSRVTATISRTAFIGLNKPDAHFEIVRVCGSVDEYEHSIFEFFRECERKGIELIICEEVPGVGLRVALMDRLRRAAGLTNLSLSDQSDLND